MKKLTIQICKKSRKKIRIKNKIGAKKNLRRTHGKNQLENFPSLHKKILFWTLFLSGKKIECVETYSKFMIYHYHSILIPWSGVSTFIYLHSIVYNNFYNLSCFHKICVRHNLKMENNIELKDIELFDSVNKKRQRRRLSTKK